MRFSVIIPVRSINAFLEENIAHLKMLDYQDFEVIILTDEPVTYNFADTRFKIVATGKKGPGEKRNIGAQKAQGEILAFLDDDAYPSENWLTSANAVFKEFPDLYALGAPALTPPTAGFLEKCSGKVLESYLTSAGTKYRHVPTRRMWVSDYPSVNLFIIKSAFDKVGGFPIQFWPGEDTKICLDLVKNYTKPFLYDPTPIVYHHRRNLFLPHLKQISRYGQHRGRFAKIFPQTSRLPAYFIPSLFVLGLIGGGILSTMSEIIQIAYLTTVLFYFTLVFIASLKAARAEKNQNMLWYVFTGIVLTHLTYGINFLLGFLLTPKLELRKIDPKTGNYLGG